jgi:hypothetical protein
MQMDKVLFVLALSKDNDDDDDDMTITKRPDCKISIQILLR